MLNGNLLAQLRQLTYLDLSGNDFNDDSELTRQLSNLNLLDTLSVKDSAIGGTLPSQVGSLVHLTHLDVSDNALTGTSEFFLLACQNSFAHRRFLSSDGTCAAQQLEPPGLFRK